VTSTLGCDVTIKTDQYALTFPYDSWRLPASLTIGNRNVLGSLRSPAFVDIGYAFSFTSFDYVDIGGSDPIPGNASATLTVAESGPAVVSVLVEDVNLSGDACGSGADLRTTFTAYPDGRVVRWDSIQMPFASCAYVASVETIQITGSSPFDHATFQSTASDAATTIEAGQVSANSYSAGGYRACFAHGSDTVAGAHIAIGYPNATTSLSHDTYYTDGGNSTALANEWLPGTGPGSALVLTAETTLQIGSTGSCGDLADANVQLPAINGAVIADGTRGLYQGTFTSGEAITISSSTDIPAGFAIELMNTTATPTVTTTDGQPLSPGSYVTQRDGLQGYTFFWFANALPAGQTLTFTPQ
jgi:hypothetical protein